MQTTHEWLVEILTDLDDRGYLKARENTRLEFKENFVFTNIANYFKAIGSFANTKGGVILFGVKDAPRIPLGIDREKFDSIQQDKISTFLAEYFSPQILWDLGIIDINGTYFGFIEIFEADSKPVICKKTNGNVLRNGDVYFRYRGQSKSIEFPELKSIHEEVRQKERDLWMKHIERISKIGPQHVAFIDLFDGAIQTGKSDGKLILDSTLLDDLKKQVKFIEEGRFVEKDGAPALKVIGEIVSSSEVLVPELDPNKDYPYLAKHLAQELSIRAYDVQVLIWKYDMKGNRKYHIDIETGKTSTANKYSIFALKYLKTILDGMKNVTEELTAFSSEYQRRNDQN